MVSCFYAVQDTKELATIVSQKSLHKIRWSSGSHTSAHIQVGIKANVTSEWPGCHWKKTHQPKKSESIEKKQMKDKYTTTILNTHTGCRAL